MIGRVGDGGGAETTLTVRAQATGQVAELKGRPGQRVTQADALMHIADTRRLWPAPANGLPRPWPNAAATEAVTRSPATGGQPGTLEVRRSGDAAATRENAPLTQRAYALGEADLQALWLARRQSVEALLGAAQARADARRVRYRPLVDGHLIWDLADD